MIPGWVHGLDGLGPDHGHRRVQQTENAAACTVEYHGTHNDGAHFGIGFGLIDRMHRQTTVVLIVRRRALWAWSMRGRTWQLRQWERFEARSR